MDEPVTVKKPGHTQIWMSPELQEKWTGQINELQEWMKPRFEKPIEGLAFLRFALPLLENEYGFKYEYTGTDEEKEA